MAAIAPETIFSIGSFPITNTLFTTGIIDLLLLLILLIGSRKITLIPGKVQGIFESLFGYFHDMTSSMTGQKRAKAIFPWVMTFFLFIAVSNFTGLIPGVGAFGITPQTHAPLATHTQPEGENHPSEDIHDSEPIQTTVGHPNTPTPAKNQTQSQPTEKETVEKHHLISFLRPATSDFNVTLALGTLSLVATHALSIKYTGIRDYIKRFISLNPILLFVGLLELVSEFIKIFSLSFRLFGNIYAGEVVLTTISGLFAFLAPLPFLLLESIVAIVQALVFATLTMVFMSMMTEKHHQEH